MPILAWMVARTNITLTVADIEFNAQIGSGFFIGHPQGIVIGRGTIIGKHVTLFQGVPFEVKSWDISSFNKFSEIGNNCYFFAYRGAMGDVKIANRCVIATHSKVMKDLPEGSLAVGVPAKTKPGKGDELNLTWTVAE